MRYFCMRRQDEGRPLLAITMGDPAGIGPEIIVKALADRALYDISRPVVLGDYAAISWALQQEGSQRRIRVVEKPAEAEGSPDHIELVAVSHLEAGTIVPGRPTLEGGEAMMHAVVTAVDMARRGKVHAMVTCPISKALMQQAGYVYEGHTQLIADLTGTEDYVMMLAGKQLRVVLVTIHCGLEEVPALLNTEGVYRTIRITARALVEDFGKRSPVLGVAALNPHAGEEGLFGSEERTVILPGIERARREGFHVDGPLPADTLFWKAAGGKYDAVVAMYHDQGLIPLKLLHFSDAVNVTLGLPIVRTSVDHGTAYDIAGRGTADPSSLTAAIRMALDIINNRRKRQ
jgi:4-hydroxythreonine-4-phosphate dehydrogenase